MIAGPPAEPIAPSAVKPASPAMSQNDDDKLPKLYYRIGEVARIVGVDPSVLRHWEHECRTVRPRRAKSGQRVYTKQDVKQLLEIRRLRYEEQLTMKGAIRRLQQVRAESHPEPAAGAPANSPEPGADVAAAAVSREQLRQILLDLRRRVVEVIAMLEDDTP